MTSEYYARRAYDQSEENSRDIQRLERNQEANFRSLSAAFNRMAAAIETLAVEVRQLRAEIHPQTLDKPRLPSPDGSV